MILLKFRQSHRHKASPRKVFVFYGQHEVLTIHLGDPFAVLVGIATTWKTENPSLEKSTPKDSVIIAALLHDVCKSDVYFRTVKQKKNKATGTWEESEGYKVSYKNFPMGHGEKSVIMILPFLELTDAEMLAIRWHMGAWDLSEYSDAKGSFNSGCDNVPLLPILMAADGLASRITELPTAGANV